MRREQLTAADLLRMISESGKRRTKKISESKNGVVIEHIEGGRTVGFSFHYPNGGHEYREVNNSL